MLTARQWGDRMIQRLRGYCPLCISRCGCVSVVEEGRLVRVEPDPDHPTGKSLCIKGKAAPELVHSPLRILQPLKRTRPKGDPDPGWQPIDWEEALAFTAERLRQVAQREGPEAVVFGVTTPSGTAIADAFAWIHRLANRFGSPNVHFATENCNWHKDFATQHTFGGGIGTPDFAHSGCILFWGFNPAVTWPAVAHAATEARRRGARLIVVDPRRAGLAGKADEWLALRPGTDTALALGIAREMLRTGGYDEGFVAQWTNGPLLVRTDTGAFLTEADRETGGRPDRLFAMDPAGDRLVPYDATAKAWAAGPGRVSLSGRFAVPTLHGPVVCRPAFDLFRERCDAYPAERVERICGVPAAQVRRTAELLGRNGPVSYYHWTGICQQSGATQAGRALGLLYALTGSLDAQGGNVQFARPPLRDVAGGEFLSDEQRAKTLGRTRRPLGPAAKGWVTTRDVVDAVLHGRPYAVRGLLNFGANFLLTKPHIRGLTDALRQLDFFVHADMFLNPTAAFADVVLPVASPWEREGLNAGFGLGEEGEALLQLRPAVVAPRGEARSDTWIVFELARRLGFADAFFNGDIQAGLRHLIEPAGVSLDVLRSAAGGIRLPLATRYQKYRQQGFATRCGRVEIYSEAFLKAGHDPLPGYVEPADGAPLFLTTAKWPAFCHSQHRSLPALRRRLPEPLAEIHPSTAAPHGIRDGDWVLIHTVRGVMRAKAALNSHIRPDTVCAQYGWWASCPVLDLPGYAIDGPHHSNYNALCDGESFDPISGSNALRGGHCRIEKA